MEQKQDINDFSGRLKILFKSGKFWKPLIAAFIGALLGFLYFYFIGQDAGHGLFSSDPYSSIVVGAFFGLFVVLNPCARGRC